MSLFGKKNPFVLSPKRWLVMSVGEGGSLKSSGFVATSTAVGGTTPHHIRAHSLKIFREFTTTNIETESLATQPDAKSTLIA